jgi:hypothetical protein
MHGCPCGRTWAAAIALSRFALLPKSARKDIMLIDLRALPSIVKHFFLTKTLIRIFPTNSMSEFFRSRLRQQEATMIAPRDSFNLAARS